MAILKKQIETNPLDLIVRRVFLFEVLRRIPLTIVINNILTPAGDVTISDLGELVLEASSSTDVTSLYSLEEISVSTDLQAAITGSEVTLFINGDQVTDVTQAPFTSTNLVDFSWELSRRGNITAGGLDLRRAGNNETNRSPLVVPVDCTLDNIRATSRTTDNWNLIVLTSPTFPAATWTIQFTGLVNGGSSNLAPALALTAGTYVRVRYDRISDNTLDPSANILLVGN